MFELCRAENVLLLHEHVMTHMTNAQLPETQQTQPAAPAPAIRTARVSNSYDNVQLVQGPLR
jgi:hypothetical protein